MRNNTFLSLFFLLSVLPAGAFAQDDPGTVWPPDDIWMETVTYAIKDTATLQMDIYQLENHDGDPQPVMMFVFGGSFARGNRYRDYYEAYFAALTREGFTVASIDYRLGMKDRKYGLRTFTSGLMAEAVQLAVEDLFSATNYLIDHAAEWNINPDSILTSGSSAGAITSLQADWVLKNRMPGSEILPDDFAYKGVIGFAGGIFSTKGAPKYSSGAPAPTLFFHGNKDRTVPYRTVRVFNIGMFTSKNLARRFRRAGYDYALIDLDGKDHRYGSGTVMTDGLPFTEWFIDRFVRGEEGGQVEMKISEGF